MGISLYCLRFGHIPFEKTGILELYEAIKNDEVDCTGVDDPNFVDLIHRILEKDAKKRITMDELRVSYFCRFMWKLLTTVGTSLGDKRRH